MVEAETVEAIGGAGGDIGEEIPQQRGAVVLAVLWRDGRAREEALPEGRGSHGGGGIGWSLR